eukprot:TRINITY_DN14112_c0_g5_i1.p1 TRINITY_DN14112_c0_g5~~TRINITY_DN14112_c0_g5_i1.p1  ORF type:complete len:322 (+),score=60.02 TRINITY_DN14112_c0_g5_i1:110-1075(+)
MFLSRTFRRVLRGRLFSELIVDPTAKAKVVAERPSVIPDIDFPYRFAGFEKHLEEQTRFLGERVFAQHRLPKDFILDHLFKIYRGVLLSSQNVDEEFLREYLEPGFAQRFVESLDRVKKQNYQLQAYKDVSGVRGEPIPDHLTIIDMHMLRGLTADRAKNGSPKDYHVWEDIEDMGLTVFTPLGISDPSNFIDPEQNKRMYEGLERILMRVLVSVESSWKLRVVTPEGELMQDDSPGSFRHVAIFESEMKPPPRFKSEVRLENYMEWIGKFKFGVWRIADIDNWMKGNSVFSQLLDKGRFDDEIFKGTKLDRDANIRLKGF